MAKYKNTDINRLYNDGSELIKVYYKNAVCYYKVYTPTEQTPCYAVVDDITQYSETEFENVYNNADSKWYKLNNLNDYEEYGVYGSGRTITTYEGKLTVDGDYEYQYSGDSWVNVGEVSGGVETQWVDFQTLNFNREYPAMTKIRLKPQGTFYTIYYSPTANTTTTDNNYTINNVRNSGSGIILKYNGTQYRLANLTQVETGVYEFTFPSACYLAGGDYYLNTYYKGTGFTEFLFVEENVSVAIYPVYYSEKSAPPNNLSFSSMTEAENYECPWVGMIVTIDDKFYEFNDEYEWELLRPKLTGTYQGKTYDLYNNITEVTSGDVSRIIAYFSPSYGKYVDFVVGDSVTTIKSNAWGIVNNVNNSSKIMNIIIPSSVKTIEFQSFYFSNYYSSYSGNSGIEFSTFDGVYIDEANFEYCTMQQNADFTNAIFKNNRLYFHFVNARGLKNLTIPSSITKISSSIKTLNELETLTCLATTPPSISSSLTNLDNLTAIYVPSGSVDAYKSASGWSDFASIIQAIP